MGLQGESEGSEIDSEGHLFRTASRGQQKKPALYGDPDPSRRIREVLERAQNHFRTTKTRT